MRDARSRERVRDRETHCPFLMRLMHGLPTPVAEREASRGQLAEPYSSTSQLEAAPLSDRCILIAEDNAIQREGTGLVLSQLGYQVVLAGNGQEAMNYLRSAKVDLLILDMMLPVRDGWSLLAEKNSDPELAVIPVVIMTALSIASREWAQSMGAVGLLRKPVDPGNLTKEIQRLI
jgi:two-component system cell cycle response regulator DivK